MSQPILYLLKPKFKAPDHGDVEVFCPYCAPIEGLLAVFPELRQNLDIRSVDFARPHGDIETLSAISNLARKSYSVTGTTSIRQSRATMDWKRYAALKTQKTCRATLLQVSACESPIHR